MLLLFGAVGLAVTGADSIRLFLRAGDRSLPALVIWGFWGLVLLAPLASAARQRLRARALEPTLAPVVREELASAAASSLLLGYGTAIFALRVVDLCLRR